MAGDRLSGWHVECPACGESYLLPAALARPAARVRCPGCHARFAAADPTEVARAGRLLAGWFDEQPGGIEGVRAARAAGHFWREHGAALLDLYEAHAAGLPAEALRAALVRALGPGRLIF